VEFFNGKLDEGISLNQLMEEFGADSFVSTQERAAVGEANVRPQLAGRQQPHVRVTPEAAQWLDRHFSGRLARFGAIDEAELRKLDWPALQPTEVTPLAKEGKRLLRVLAKALATHIVPGRPETFLTYKQSIEQMGIEPWEAPA
jgi:hypothetical protein